MPADARITTVRRYLTEVLDGGNLALVPELFTPDCIIHRPEAPGPIIGTAGLLAIVGSIGKLCTSMHTTIADVFASDDRVVARLRHDIVIRGEMRTRVGAVPAAGKAVGWTAIAIFRMAGDMIAEEWVERDEAGLLQQLGVF